MAFQSHTVLQKLVMENQHEGLYGQPLRLLNQEGFAIYTELTTLRSEKAKLSFEVEILRQQVGCCA